MRLPAMTVPVVATLLAVGYPAAAAIAVGDQPSVDKVVRKTVLTPEETGSGAKMTAVANLQYELTGTSAQDGSDIEFGRIGGRDYAFAGTLGNGMQIVDITVPTAPVLAAVFDCQISQGDIQVFRQGLRVLATYTADGSVGDAGAASTCGTDLGLTADDAGTVLVDITDPTKPTSLGFAPVSRGSHNMTVHPSGRYLYNSNSDLITSTEPTITIFDISNPAAPVLVQDYAIPFVPASLGSESHDITFSADGTRAYSAALSQTLVLDTTDPAKPEQIAQIVDPTIQVVHGADPLVLKRADGTERTLLAISDEQAGAATGTNCPGGGLHFYDITGELEKAPAKVATWFIEQARPSTATCTAHVFRMHGDQGLITVAWYDEGVRVLDVSGLADETGSPANVLIGTQGGIQEIGAYVFPDSNTWSFKTNAIAADGSFFGYGNDLGRGFDVYRFDGLSRTVPPLTPVELRGVGPVAAPPAAGGPAVAGPATPPQTATGVLPSTGTGPTTAVVASLLLLLWSVALVRRRSQALSAA